MSTVPRKVFIAGNWKCNSTREFANTHSKFLTSLEIDKRTTELCVAIPNIHLLSSKVFLTGKVFVASQNISMFDNGPYTGEVSAKQFMDIGVDWTIIGKSERRTLFQESEKELGEKIKRAFEVGMHVIYCVGESTEQRNGGKTFEVLDLELDTLIANAGKNWDNVVVVYEPYDNGVEVVLNNEQIQEAHDHIRNYLKTKGGDDVAKRTRIVYGGVVDEKNCQDIIALKDVDGFLVGDASLKQEEFKTIVECAKNKKFEEESPETL